MIWSWVRKRRSGVRSVVQSCVRKQINNLRLKFRKKKRRGAGIFIDVRFPSSFWIIVPEDTNPGRELKFRLFAHPFIHDWFHGDARFTTLTLLHVWLTCLSTCDIRDPPKFRGTSRPLLTNGRRKSGSHATRCHGDTMSERFNVHESGLIMKAIDHLPFLSVKNKLFNCEFANCAVKLHKTRVCG